MANLELPEPFASIPRHALTLGPSPIHPLPRMSAELNPKVAIYAKREDLTSPFAYGGNKTRKLEYLVPEALEQNATHLISIGGVQSNHTRQVAATAAHLGLKATLVQEKWVEHDSPWYDQVGNIQLSRLCNADVRLDPSGFGIEHKETLKAVQEEIVSQGGKPYYIPAGASDHPCGGLGFARWAFEVRQQETQLGIFFDTIVVCAVTGSTFAGMLAGFKLLEKNGQSPKRKIIGIDASAKPKETFDQVLRIAKFTAAKIGLQESDIIAEDVILNEKYHAGVYGLADEKTVEAIKFGARTEAFITDPVYEGKTLAGLMDLIENGEIASGSTVLFAHLGGQMALNAYDDLV
jgi:1-aminocyclopropane-1-carboxylate deaminase